MINPKKKDQIKTGWLSNRYFNPFASENTLIPIPSKTLKRKVPLMAFQNSAILKLKRSLMALRFTDLIELINSSYIPVIKAIVPPETPGTTSAAPIAIPFKIKTK